LPKEFLGVGWKFPVTVDSGKIAMSKYEDDIREAIWLILSTAKGERIMHPDFGCEIHDMVFQTVNVVTLSSIEMAVREALTLHEPRIKVMRIDVSSEEALEGKLVINIDYCVKTTDNQFNIVYPFDISEGK
jgi:hypothetical protein